MRRTSVSEFFVNGVLASGLGGATANGDWEGFSAYACAPEVETPLVGDSSWFSGRSLCNTVADPSYFTSGYKSASDTNNKCWKINQWEFLRLWIQNSLCTISMTTWRFPRGQLTCLNVKSLSQDVLRNETKKCGKTDHMLLLTCSMCRICCGTPGFNANPVTPLR